MPYKIVKDGDKYCVAKQDTGQPIKGGCHADRAEAVDHLQALYANEAMAAIAESFLIENTEVTTYEALTAAFTLTERNWKGPIAFENVSTGDNRQFNSSAITFDKLPLPLLFQRTSGEGHSGSVVIGRVDEITRPEDDSDVIFAKGVILEGIPEADEFLALMEHGAAGGVSVDGDSAQYQVEEVEEGGQKKVQFTSMRIRGLTAVAIPAFADAQIELTDEAEETQDAETEELSLDDIEANEEILEETLEELAAKRRKKRKTQRAYSWKLAEAEGITASSAPVKPPLEWFVNPLLEGPTPLTITPDGQVFGHISLWGTCHIGMPKCTTPPKGGTYNYFHTGALETDDGIEVAVGHLTFNTGHASVYDNAFNAASHYDNTGTVGADVVAGEDKFGIWVAGALRPTLTDEDIRVFKAAPISGDWRRISGKMELVAALSVNTPGFPVPRAKALVASASLNPETVITVQDGDEMSDLSERSEFRTFLADKVRAIFADAPCKTEADGSCYPASDYAYVPDPEKSSTWKLRLTSTPGGKPDAQIVGAALAALGKGFRGNKVQIPAEDLSAVKKKVKAAWLEANKDKDSEDVPSVVAASETVSLTADTVEFNIEHIQGVITKLNAAIAAFDKGDEEAGMRALDSAEESLNDVIDAYDNEDYGDEGDDYEDYVAETEEFASCTSARKRVRNARRSLRKALRALASCDGPYRRVVVVTPPTTGMSADTEELADLEMITFAGEGGWEIVNWGGGKPYCVKPSALNPTHYESLKKPLACFKTEAEAQAHIDGLAPPSAEYLKEHAIDTAGEEESKPAMSVAEEWLESLSTDELIALAVEFEESDLDIESLTVEEFYNQCHDPDTGFFCEGPDGPGRAADNLKKAEAIVGKKAPTYIKNLISRRLGSAQKNASKTLGKKAPQYMKDLLSKRVSEAVTKNQKVEDLPIGEYKRSSRGRRPKG